jgi:hypothetical protein
VHSTRMPQNTQEVKYKRLSGLRTEHIERNNRTNGFQHDHSSVYLFEKSCIIDKTKMYSFNNVLKRTEPGIQDYSYGCFQKFGKQKYIPKHARESVIC